jgi:hypothetical protein
MADLYKYKGITENATRLKYEVLRRSYGKKSTGLS